MSTLLLPCRAAALALALARAELRAELGAERGERGEEPGDVLLEGAGAPPMSKAWTFCATQWQRVAEVRDQKRGAGA